MVRIIHVAPISANKSLSPPSSSSSSHSSSSRIHSTLHLHHHLHVHAIIISAVLWAWIALFLTPILVAGIDSSSSSSSSSSTASSYVYTSTGPIDSSSSGGAGGGGGGGGASGATGTGGGNSSIPTPPPLPGPYNPDYFPFGLNFNGGPEMEHILAIVAIVWGLITLFFGVKLFKLTLFVITSVVIGGISYYLIMVQTNGNSEAAFIASVVVGLLAGVIVVKIFVLGLILIGVFTTFILWECFLSLFPNVVPQSALYTVLCVVLSIAAILAWWQQKWVLLFTTPIIGTFLFSQGLAKYLNNDSLKLSVFEILHNDASCNTKQCLGLYAGLAVIGTLGLFVQYYYTSGLREPENKGAPKGEERGQRL